MGTWHEKWFGFWRAAGDEDRNLPLLSEWVDTTWNPPDKTELARYVAKAPIILASGTTKAPCPMCSTMLSTSDYQSDGDWLWPVDLSHYVSEHGVRIPDELVLHIRGRGHEPPKRVDMDISQYPWP